MLKAVMLSIFALNSTLFASGGNEVGNGGGGVHCRATETVKASLALLDYYAGRQLFNFHLIEAAPTESPFAIAARILARLERLDPARASHYRKRLDLFFENTVFIEKAPLPETNDFGEIALPSRCRITQICVQRRPQFPEEKKYRVHRDSWDRLTNLDRAGLMLHELIYEDALQLGHKDSRGTRYITALLSSVEFDRLNGEDFQDRLKKAGFVSDGKEGPIWAANPIRLRSASESILYVTSIRSFIISNSTFSIRKKSGPGWLFVGTDGVLRGTPPLGLSIEGDQRFTLELIGSNGKTDETTIIIPLKETIR